MKYLVTGSAGFVGYHVSNALLEAGNEVVGIDSFTDYYDPALKRARSALLEAHPGYRAENFSILDADRLQDVVAEHAPRRAVHLAAQPGVRYSLENPRAYVETNIIGTLNLIEAIRHSPDGIDHLLVASTSSAYGANADLPYRETDRTAFPISTYAATKIGVEALTHSYAHLFKMPTTCFRFFTVYGPWGRPDMAPFIFTKAILEQKQIDVYGDGSSRRDYTFIDDLVGAVGRLADLPPEVSHTREQWDSSSPAAPWRAVNIGGGSSVSLMDFIGTLEDVTGMPALLSHTSTQPGDVRATQCDVTMLEALVGESPSTPLSVGLKQTVDWYKSHFTV